MKKSLLLVLAVAASMSSAHSGVSNLISGLSSSAKNLVDQAEQKVIAKYNDLKGTAAEALADIPGAFGKFKDKVKSLTTGDKAQIAAGYLTEATSGEADAASELVNSFVIDN